MSFTFKKYYIDEVLRFIITNEQYSMSSLFHYDFGFNFSDLLESIINNKKTPQDVRDTANSMCQSEWILDF